MPEVFVPQHGVVRLSCDTCVKGHRTGECKCWDTKRQIQLAQRYINEVNDLRRKAGIGPSDGPVTLFRKTNKSGRPSLKEKNEKKDVTEFFAVLRLPAGALECGKLIGTMKTSKDTGKVIESCCAPQSEESPPQPDRSASCHQFSPPSASQMDNLPPTYGHLPRYLAVKNEYSTKLATPPSLTHPQYSTQPRVDFDANANASPPAVDQQNLYSGVVPMRLGDINVDPSSHGGPVHRCRCGETCACAFCPMHPNNSTTKRHFHDIVQRSWEQGSLNYFDTSAQVLPETRLHDHQDNSSGIPTCNGRFPSNPDLMITPDLNACLDLNDDHGAVPNNTWFARFTFPEGPITGLDLPEFSAFPSSTNGLVDRSNQTRWINNFHGNINGTIDSHNNFNGINELHSNISNTNDPHRNMNGISEPQTGFSGISGIGDISNGINESLINTNNFGEVGDVSNRDITIDPWESISPATTYEPFDNPQYFVSAAHGSPATATWVDGS